jgi:GxxExxY protein
MRKHFKEVDAELDEIAKQVVDAAFKVHFNLGPGLLENAYEACLAYEIGAKGLKVEKQVEVPLDYQTVHLNVGYRIDLLVENRLIVEVKAVESLLPVHRAQVITYLKFSGNQLGFLVNFNAPILKKGLERIVLSKAKKT